MQDRRQYDSTHSFVDGPNYGPTLRNGVPSNHLLRTPSELINRRRGPEEHRLSARARLGVNKGTVSMQSLRGVKKIEKGLPEKGG
ncbi:hypothetical protein NDU88_004603 [Pleurodeles waltl]|uniref:Uncharacterized protein n=1 Tax=Pleurodeles waltl TaxID=8319 RepID=A0AAV7UFQ5_PLEWA|nr:hypothetical protein NDU88_004603 [Pleurodeles waltl]